ncbi:MAG TPA: PEGA domain-containing protein, partial [Polyangiaceae bacterium]
MLRGLGLLLSLTAPLVFAKPLPLGQSLPADAKRDYDAGRLLFEDGDYPTALLKYRAAYDATHDVRLLWDVAVCQKNLRHYAKALATLARYAAEGGDVLSAQDKKDAADLTRALRPLTEAETIRVSETGAEVAVDGEAVGTSPLAAPVVLDIGTRRVRVSKEGYRTWEEEVPVGGSAPTTVDVKLERAAGHLEVHVPDGAAVAVDEHDVGHGPRVLLDLPSGVHAVRVTAPRMRPLMTDVMVEDGRSRTLDLTLEPEAEPSSEVHVAVGCGSPEPVGQEGLAVFFDDATESALPLGVRMRREPGREVVAYVAFRVPPGKHAVHVAALGCDSLDTTVVAPEGGVADVRGSLPLADTWFQGSAAGSPDGWRIGVGLVESSTTFSSYNHFFLNYPSGALPNPLSIGMTMFGPSIVAGLQTRWTTVLVDARFEYGRNTGVVFDKDNNYLPINVNSRLTQWLVGARPGVRLPLYIAALSGGLGVHLGQYFFTPDSGSSKSGL